jgi:membrane-bound acyltransferase YfiQ involved in biofilm formation
VVHVLLCSKYNECLRDKKIKPRIFLTGQHFLYLWYLVYERNADAFPTALQHITVDYWTTVFMHGDVQKFDYLPQDVK